MTETIDTLQKYGPTFQTKCVVALMTDKAFLEQSYDILNPAHFESEPNRWLVDRIMWYFNTYKMLPTPEVLASEITKIPADTVLRGAAKDQFFNVYNIIQSNPDDLTYIKNELLTFAKNQALKAAVLKSAELLTTGKYDQIKTLIDKAMNAGVERNLGHNWNTDLETRISKMARNVIPTPWACFNHIMDGGLGSGEIGTIVAPSGIGKSWILAKLGAHAVSLGYRVVHYTFELQENYLGLRYDTIFTGIEPTEIKNHKDKVMAMLEAMKGNLTIKYFPTRTVTVNALRAHLNRMITLDQRPDLLIIDYADLMRSAEKADARHEELGFIVEEIRGMLGEFKIPGWTASQSQRSSLQDDVVEMDKIAGSYAKVMANDFIFSLSRKLADKMTNTARVHVPKNRFGPDGMTFPALLDLAHGKIEVFDENSPEGVKIKNTMHGAEGTVKEILAKKLVDHRQLRKQNGFQTEAVENV